MRRRFFLFAPLPLVPLSGVLERAPQRGKDMTPKILLQSNDDVVVKNTVVTTELFRGSIESNLILGDHGIRVTLFGKYINGTSGDHGAILYFGIGGYTSMVAIPIVVPLVGWGAVYEATCHIFAKGSATAQEGFGRFLASEVGAASNVQLATGSASANAADELDVTVRVALDHASNSFQWVKSKVVVELL